MRNENENNEIKDGLYIPKKKKSFEVKPGFAYFLF